MHHLLPFCVYILLSQKDNNFYVGYTTDLSHRLAEHNQGQNTSTAPRRPFALLHCEFYLAQADAERRETYLKAGIGQQQGRRNVTSLTEQQQERSPPLSCRSRSRHEKCRASSSPG